MSEDASENSLLIGSRTAAENLELFSLLLGTDADHWARACSERGQRSPFSIPAGQEPRSEKETPWFLDAGSVTPGQTQTRQMLFFTTRPHRSVFMDFSDMNRSLYGFRIESEEADMSQSISIASKTCEVATEQFLFRIRAENFSNALDMALSIASTVYACGQYKITEVVGFGLRLMSEESSVALKPHRKKFRLDRDLPPDGIPLSVASQVVLPESPDGRRLPVVSIDLIPADRERWNVGVVLRRPAARGLVLMPLHKRLMRSLWSPIFRRIFSNSPLETGK